MHRRSAGAENQVMRFFFHTPAPDVEALPLIPAQRTCDDAHASNGTAAEDGTRSVEAARERVPVVTVRPLFHKATLSRGVIRIAQQAR